jgi:excinuclease ABC subunit A
MTDAIEIRGARVHNLKNISLTIPRNKLVVITGLSGSGKSSLAFDTLYAEGQRRYVESLSAYARQFLGIMDKPDVDEIHGLSPAISIDQRSATKNPRSTVGTVTEIYDYLRLLYARTGVPHCPQCGQKVERQTVQQIVDRLLALPEGTPIIILAPLVRDRKGEHKQVLHEVQRAGYVRVRIDGVVMSLEEAQKLTLNRQRRHSIEVVIDRVLVEHQNPDKHRLADSVETAGKLGDGVVIVENRQAGRDLIFSEQFACQRCGLNMPELEPRSFSFNSPHGACPTCTGLGTRLTADPELVIPNRRLTLAEGAIKPWSKPGASAGWHYRQLADLAERYHFSLHVPVRKLPAKIIKIILYGEPQEHASYLGRFEGVLPNLERRYKETDSDYVRSELERYMVIKPCPACRGKRLRPEILAVTVAGKGIAEVVSWTAVETLYWCEQLARGKAAHPEFGPRERRIAKQILRELISRLGFLADVGLDYLTLDRSAATLAGGEAQRIRLATQIGSGLTGVLYILDEPSIGLHYRDNARLIATLKRLRALGNTVIVVEHDEETIRSADYVVDIGAGAGAQGGEVVFTGTPAQLARSSTLTGKYLSGRMQVPLPAHPRRGNGKFLEVRGAREHNLKNINVKFPLGTFICVTGVSGSGKSTLVNDILARALAREYHGARTTPGAHERIIGLRHLDKVIVIDQSPIGRTPRSNAATYTGLFTPIRELFAATPEARLRGYAPGRFSFNVKGGRCERCQGDGLLRIEMQFLPDVYIECEACRGKRYNREALEIEYRGKNIAEILDMSVDEALVFFRNIPAVANKLQTLAAVGLGYLHLGQPATQLSGGEAQRVKLAAELSRRATGRTLYILDEPTTGLHFDDVCKLLSVLHALVDKGNTVIVIEHHLDVIKNADWIIDLGPEGGERGGYIVAEGPPLKLARYKKSYTGQALAKRLQRVRYCNRASAPKP